MELRGGGVETDRELLLALDGAVRIDIDEEPAVSKPYVDDLEVVRFLDDADFDSDDS